MGARLATEAPVEADMVMPVPNCARCAAIGYADESGVFYGRGFTTSHYIGRSFIMPDQDQRDMVVKIVVPTSGSLSRRDMPIVRPRRRPEESWTCAEKKNRNVP